MQGEAVIDAEAGTATVSLDWYNSVIEEKKSFFDLIEEIQKKKFKMTSRTFHLKK